MGLEVSPAQHAARQCGGCTVCCIHLPIPAGKVAPYAKMTGVECPHLRESGCTIYAHQPRLCADFRCAWLADEVWPGAWRPDRSGLLCLRETLRDGRRGSLIYETRPAALQASPAAEIIDELRRTTAFVIVVDWDGKRERFEGFFAPDHLSASSGPMPVTPPCAA